MTQELDGKLTFVFKNCNLLLIPTDEACSVRSNVDIWISHGFIAHITDAGTKPEFEVPRDLPTLDGTGLLATPGLSNSHTHSPLSLMKGAAEDVNVDDWFNKRIWPMELNLTPDRVFHGTRLAAAEMLLGGVTSFADHYFYAPYIAEAAVSIGIRANIAPTFFSTDGREVIETRLQEASEINSYPSKLISASLGPHAPYTVNESDLVYASKFAIEYGLQFHIHASENMAQTESSLRKFDVTPIEILERTGVLEAGCLIAHGTGIVESDYSLLEKYANSISVASCPKVYLKHSISPSTPIRNLRKANVNVGVGTDGAAGHGNHDVWESLRLMALIQKSQENDPTWMNVSDVLKIAFLGGSKATQVVNGGEIKPGNVADIVLIDLFTPRSVPNHDPIASLVYSVSPTDVRHVMVAGDLVVRDGELLTADINEILQTASEIAPELIRISGEGAVQHYEP